MTKEELRKHYLDKRRALSSDLRKRYSHIIVDRLIQEIDWDECKLVHLFLPIEKYAEVDLLALINYLEKEYPSITIVVPRCDFKTQKMQAVVYTSSVKLSRLNNGIPEPIEGELKDHQEIDLVITPLIVCDEKGYRIGYGKGFYDQLFSECNNEVKKIGVGFFPPIKTIEAVDEWDVPLEVYFHP